jgi:transcriptional regulator with XRE-family HTH domain
MIDVARLKSRLTALNLNPNAASQRAGLGRDYVRDILRGRIQNPSAQRLNRLAEALECKPAYLLGEDLDHWIRNFRGEPDDRTSARVAEVRNFYKTIGPKEPLPVGKLIFDLLDSVDDRLFAELVFYFISKAVADFIANSDVLSKAEKGILLGDAEIGDGADFERHMIVAKLMGLLSKDGYYQGLIVAHFWRAVKPLGAAEVFSNQAITSALGPLFKSYKIAPDPPKEVMRLVLTAIVARHFMEPGGEDGVNPANSPSDANI